MKVTELKHAGTVHQNFQSLGFECNNNFMAINFAKTKYIQFRGTRCLKVGNFLFDSTPFMKDLGLIVSEKLTWSSLKALYAI